MPKLVISGQSEKLLTSFKKVMDYIWGGEIDTTEYLDLVIDKGIKSMISDIIPKNIDVLWDTIELISVANPEFFSQFMVEMLNIGGKELNKQAAKQRLGFIKE